MMLMGVAKASNLQDHVIHLLSRAYDAEVDVEG